MSLEMLHGHQLDIVPVASIQKWTADQTHYCEAHCWIYRNTQRNNHNDKRSWHVQGLPNLSY